MKSELNIQLILFAHNELRSKQHTMLKKEDNVHVTYVSFKILIRGQFALKCICTIFWQPWF